jgi:mRNA-degrading endonuclease RelE of RelBE toxin-antitoxin system
MVERIESYRFSKRFKKEYNALSKEIQKVFDKKLTLFLKELIIRFYMLIRNNVPICSQERHIALTC